MIDWFVLLSKPGLSVLTCNHDNDEGPQLMLLHFLVQLQQCLPSSTAIEITISLPFISLLKGEADQTDISR